MSVSKRTPTDEYLVLQEHIAEDQLALLTALHNEDQEVYDKLVRHITELVSQRDALDLDVSSSASRQHYIDTGEYLKRGEAL